MQAMPLGVFQFWFNRYPIRGDWWYGTKRRGDLWAIALKAMIGGAFGFMATATIAGLLL
ncbi:hypothetical protein Ct9H90mP29_21950 [bacterium]|nr:MAG: hypothetical protein Ct9H90mP29_21950 [bacterium]